jgi:polysaccharide deacetylase family protein (PEP-CTERM system associated)
MMFTNILTVDLEDWFVVENLKQEISSDQWEQLPSRIEESTHLLLDLFSKYNVRSTFFVLGWIANNFPDLIKEIARRGHEVACHSYSHTRVDQLGEEAFREDTKRAIDIISEVSGVTPTGYRAPSWSINSKTPWAFEVLAELGFKYDSSIFPIKHDIYGELSAPRNIFKKKLESGRTIIEIPASTIKFFGKNLPVCGGGYLRHSPYWYTAMMLRKMNQNNQPAVVYIHPWEFDNDQPRLEQLSMFQKFRQYGSISTMKKKLEKLLSEFDFIPAGDYVNIVARKKIGFEK